LSVAQVRKQASPAARKNPHFFITHPSPRRLC
jgi:hypothetical protein